MNHQHTAFDGQERRKAPAGPAGDADAVPAVAHTLTADGRMERDAPRYEFAADDRTVAADSGNPAKVEQARTRYVRGLEGEVKRLRGELARASAVRDLEAKPAPAGDVPADVNAEHQRQLKIVFAERNEAQNDARRHKRALADRDSEIAAMKELRQRREAELAEAKAERDKAEARLAKVSAEGEVAAENYAKVVAERDDALLEQDKAEADLEIANAERGQAAHERDKLRAELAEAKTARARELDKAHLDRRQAENLLDEVKAERDSLRAERDECRDRINELEAKERKHIGDLNRIADIANPPPF